ncbi:hypothetical protein GJ689_24255 [Rhodoplanes serenus]|uniref:Lipocalin-like domain-containing protein n=1 Tax=Rhodoplanes serenus TaxID=200615 RepID=A0A9X5AVP8_9BRAD|nr:hypothetical protein [Rhodoplanes serenus]MTW19308.1 hypothetical protein [Rhodoplanes serenus]
MTESNTEGLKGKWRIVKMPGFALDCAAPAYSALDGRGGGAIVFNAFTAALDCTIATDAADSDWQGSDEGDEVRGDGFVELQPDGSFQGEFAYDNGDDSTFKARPE